MKMVTRQLQRESAFKPWFVSTELLFYCCCLHSQKLVTKMLEWARLNSFDYFSSCWPRQISIEQGRITRHQVLQNTSIREGGPMDGPTDGPADRRTDGRTDPLIEMLQSTT